MAEYIDKMDVVNKLIRLENNYQFYKEVWDADVLYRRICELEIGIGKEPATDVAPVVHGRWDRTSRLGEFDRCNAHCTNCGYEIGASGWSHEWKLPYCPNCGAKMDLKEEN